MTSQASIIQSILESYGSLENPMFSFINSRAQTEPYKELLEKLSLTVSVFDETEPNNDHCLTLILKLRRKGWKKWMGWEEWILQLSYVSRYGILIKLPARRVITNGDVMLDETERLIISALDSQSVVLLGRQTLEQKITLKLFVAEPDDTRLYQALFTDTDFLPFYE